AVRLGVGEPGKLVSDLQDLLLKEQDPCGVAQDRPKYRVLCPECVGHLSLWPRPLHRIPRLLCGPCVLCGPCLPPLLLSTAPLTLWPCTLCHLLSAPRYIRPHEAALYRSRPKQSRLHNQVVEALRLRLRQQMPLPGALNLEDCKRLPRPYKPHGC